MVPVPGASFGGTPVSRYFPFCVGLGEKIGMELFHPLAVLELVLSGKDFLVREAAVLNRQNRAVVGSTLGALPPFGGRFPNVCPPNRTYTSLCIRLFITNNNLCFLTFLYQSIVFCTYYQGLSFAFKHQVLPWLATL